MARAPLSRSASIPPRPSISREPSFGEMMPHLASIAACAMLPRMSSLYIRESTPMEELKLSAAASSAPCAAPAQSFSILPSPFRSRLRAYFLFLASTWACTFIGRP